MPLLKLTLSKNSTLLKDLNQLVLDIKDYKTFSLEVEKDKDKDQLEIIANKTTLGTWTPLNNKQILNWLDEQESKQEYFTYRVVSGAHHWFYEDDNGDYKRVADDVNEIMERSYDTSKVTVHGSWSWDWSAMTQTSTLTKTVRNLLRTPIKRKQLVYLPVYLPSYVLSYIDGTETTPLVQEFEAAIKNHATVELKTISATYSFDKFIPHFSKKAAQRYLFTRDWLKDEKSTHINEMLLYHGTSSTDPDVAAEEGLKVNHSKMNNYFGRAIYLASTPDFVLKANYGHVKKDKVYILVCAVIVGNWYIGKQHTDFKEPPRGYDSVRFIWDKQDNTDEDCFAIYNDAQVLVIGRLEYNITRHIPTFPNFQLPPTLGMAQNLATFATINIQPPPIAQNLTTTPTNMQAPPSPTPVYKTNCGHIKLLGKNKGQVCGKKTAHNSDYCVVHRKRYLNRPI